MIRAALTLAFVGTLAPVAVSAQSAASARRAPAFEVASIRPNLSGDTTSTYRVPPQGLVAITNSDLRGIIAQAYGIDGRSLDYLLTGGDDKILSARFDITAKPPDDAPPGQQLAMLQTLLAERFMLRIRREIREVPVYELRQSQEGSRFGPQLRASDHNCRATTPPRPPRAVCDTQFLRSTTQTNPAGRGVIVALGLKNAGPITALVRDVQQFADRPVLDLTGLTGNYEWHLTATNRGVANSDYPSVFAAVQEQLGLRLEPARGPIEVLVIDSVEPPTPD